MIATRIDRFLEIKSDKYENELIHFLIRNYNYYFDTFLILEGLLIDLQPSLSSFPGCVCPAEITHKITSHPSARVAAMQQQNRTQFNSHYNGVFTNIQDIVI